MSVTLNVVPILLVVFRTREIAGLHQVENAKDGVHNDIDHVLEGERRWLVLDL